jgi:hypothetical protein
MGLIQIFEPVPDKDVQYEVPDRWIFLQVPITRTLLRSKYMSRAGQSQIGAKQKVVDVQLLGGAI